jgi:protein O-GlcNAc transferase
MFSLKYLLSPSHRAGLAATAAQAAATEQAAAHKMRGNALLDQGDWEQAALCYRQALAAAPNDIDACINLGFTLRELKRLPEAQQALNQALMLDPQAADAHYMLGTIARMLGDPARAVERFEQTLAIQPDFETAYPDLCVALFESGQAERAREVALKGIAISPDRADLHFYLGNLEADRKAFDAAIQSYRTALALHPDYAEAHNNLGQVLRNKGDVEQAIACYRQALMLKPDFSGAHSNLLFAMIFHRGSTPAAYVEEARRYGRKLMEQARPYTDWTVRAPVDGRLRIGLVSGDFNQHPVSFFLDNILAHLDRSKIELVAYPTRAGADSMTARIQAHCAAWRPLTDLPDQAAAQRIHDDGIHILVDLSGHTAYNRLPVFAWKPAPVQVSWLGYLASTGVPGMDYLLADPVSLPAANEAHFTEKVWRLPDSLNCFTPPSAGAKLDVAPLPASRNGHVTFGTFQYLAKVDDAALAVWSRVLKALPGARLRLQMKQMSEAGARQVLEQKLARAGIGMERVLLAGWVADREDYLATHGEVDIILDTFPYVGITTTCEALWMGVPTVTLAGGTLLSRQGASLLTCVGLQDWIAADEDDYVARAVAHASDLQRLAQLRATLRDRSLASPLFDVPRFARHLEQALYGMWEKRRV